MTTAPHATPPMDRPSWMGVLARAPVPRLAALFPEIPAHSLLRAPEVGAIMVRGRIGGVGQPFNLGEMTITRCTLSLAAAGAEAGAGAVGHAWVQGRDRSHALRAAAVDALMQTDQATAIEAAVLAPLAAEEAARKSLRASKAAATKVEFFTLQRGEDQ